LNGLAKKSDISESKNKIAFCTLNDCFFFFAFKIKKNQLKLHLSLNPIHFFPGRGLGHIFDIELC